MVRALASNCLSPSNLSTFIFNKLGENIDIRTPAGKARFAQTVRPVLEKFPSGVFKNLIFKELEKKVGSPIHYGAAVINQNRSGKESLLASKTTPVRLAISALLNEPSIAKDANFVAELEKSSIAGLPLLIQIIGIWRQEPELKSAALIERFRGKPEEQQMQKLLIWNPPELKDPKQAFNDALAWIFRKTQNDRVQELIDKESTDGLTEDERQEFRNLLHQKAS